MHHHPLVRWACLALLLLSSRICIQAAPGFSASLEQDSIALGQSTRLILSFTDTSPTEPPRVPEVQNLAISYLGPSTQLIISGGRSVSTTSFLYRVIPSQAGEYLIPSLSVTAGGQSFQTQPLRLTVTPSDTPTTASGQERVAFIRLLSPKDTVYAGEAFPVEVQLFYQSAQDANLPQLRGDGFILGQPVQQGQSRTQIGNAFYNIVNFRVLVTALKTGALALGPAELRIVLRIPSRRNDPFGFFGPSYELRPTTLYSDPLKIQVRPLPDDGKPPTFNGAVGEFSFLAKAAPTNLMVGDPITLTVQIAGKGAFQSAPYPSQTNWSGFKLYPANSKFQPTDALGFAGVKTFEQVAIPEDAALREIPGFVFSFFDPARKQYRQIAPPPIAISIHASDQADPQPTVLARPNTASDAAEHRDIVHIKPSLALVGPARPPLLFQPWFLSLQLVPIAAAIAALLWRKRETKLATDPRFRRHLQVQHVVRKGLRQLASYAHGNDPAQFFALVFRLLQEQIGERLDLPASAITEAVLDEPFLAGAATAGLRASLHELFQLCNQARYAPSFSTQELQSLVPKVQSALRDLQQLPAKTP